MYPNQLITVVTYLAAAIAEDQTPENIALLASIFTQLGDTLTTIAAQQAVLLIRNQDNASKDTFI